MKKILSVLMVVVLLASLAACGRQDADAAAATDDAATQTFTGVVSDIRAEMLILEPQSEDGFDILFAVDAGVEGVADLSVGDRVTVTYTGELESVDTAPVAVDVEKEAS